jgi:Carboxypeptidase regulatory-like domain
VEEIMMKKFITELISFLLVGVCFAPTLLGEIVPKSADYTHNQSAQYEGTLSGFVTDPSMNPIPGAKVRVNFHGNYSENYSDDTGYYHVINIPICYCMKNTTCSKEGYQTEWVLLSISENTTYDFILIPLNSGFVFLNGTMGENEWYISNVSIMITGTNLTFYKIDDGSWTLYSGPFIITSDGYHQIFYYWVDEWGNHSDMYSTEFKIDKTSPTIQLSAQRINRTKVKITATVTDALSGVYNVVFYDDMGNRITIYDPPYEILYIGFSIHIIHAIVSDYAGNIAHSKIVTSFNQKLNVQFVHHFLNQRFIDVLQNLRVFLQKIQQ